MTNDFLIYTIKELMDFYALDLFHSTTFKVVFDVQMDSSLATGSPFQVGSKSYWHDSSRLDNFLWRISSFIMSISCARSTICHLFKDPWFLSVKKKKKKCLRDQNRGTKYNLVLNPQPFPHFSTFVWPRVIITTLLLQFSPYCLS